MPGAVRAIADAAIGRLGGKADHPNRVAMRQAIDAHIAQARSMDPTAGAEFLGRCLLAVHRNRDNLADDATGRGTLSPSLEGLTIFDIDEAQYQLEVVRRELRTSAAPYPFCHRMTDCTPVGRCLSDPVCCE
jgi:hypothetical protein